MASHSLTDPTAFITEARNGIETHNDENYEDHNYNKYGNGTDSDYFMFDQQSIFCAFTILFCIFGMLGNGMVIWLLGFRIKKNPFTTFVLNLAVADFGVLVTAVTLQIITTVVEELTEETIVSSFLSIIFHIYLFLFNTSQYLLTVLSMDRCISVFFPFWHHCHRPKYLSDIVCALIWVLLFLPFATIFIIDTVEADSPSDDMKYLFFVNVHLPIPLMIISSLMIFFNICCQSEQQRKLKPLITILATVFFFLFVCFPFNASFMGYDITDDDNLLDHLIFLFSCLNSSVNPFLYYLIGRPRKGRSKKSMKVALQKLFKEEEICTESMHRSSCHTSNQQPGNCAEDAL